jgi:hypothetical protein
MDDAPTSPADFEREKWLADLEIRRQELDLKRKEQSRTRLTSPLFLAVVGAAIAAAGNAYVSWLNGNVNQQTEAFRAESARILKAIEANEPEKAKTNLRFLIAAGLITDPTASRVAAFIDALPSGKGPVLPSQIAAWAREPVTPAMLKAATAMMHGPWTSMDTLVVGGLSGSNDYNTVLHEIKEFADFDPQTRCDAYRQSPQLLEDIKRHGDFNTPEMDSVVAKALVCSTNR